MAEEASIIHEHSHKHTRRGTWGCAPRPPALSSVFVASTYLLLNLERQFGLLFSHSLSSLPVCLDLQRNVLNVVVIRIRAMAMMSCTTHAEHDSNCPGTKDVNKTCLGTIRLGKSGGLLCFHPL